MIPKDYITAWRAQAAWRLDAQVEQDLVISRALVELFSVREVASSLVFRGGTALYKIYLILLCHKASGRDPFAPQTGQ